MWLRRKDKGTTTPPARPSRATKPADVALPTTPAEIVSRANVDGDDALIDRTLAGENEAFGELVVRHQDRLYNTLAHVTGDADEAREVAQDAFVQAFVKLATFQRSSTFYTWLFRIAFNLQIGRKRRERRHRIWEQFQLAGGSGAAVGQEPGRRLEAAECAQCVRAAIDALADDHREVLLLREMEGCPYDEISRILDVPVGTVRSRLHRARAHLREILRLVHRQQLK
jgi:RNA polymerase sigma-70 factor (ECF subfamily)